MAPVARWIFAAAALVALWVSLHNVPVRVTYLGPDGAVVFHDWIRYDSVAAWEAPQTSRVTEAVAERGNVLARGHSHHVAYKCWNECLENTALDWVVCCGLLWPFCWLLRRRPGWLAASRFSMVCLALGLLWHHLLLVSSSPTSANPLALVPVFLVFTMGRAAAAPEGGPPWFGMVAGRRALGASLLMLAGSVICLLAFDGRLVAFLSTVALGIAPALCLAPRDQIWVWARHFGVIVLSLFVACSLSELLAWANATLAPPDVARVADARDLLGGFASFALWLLLIAAAVPIARLYRKALDLWPSALPR